MPSKLVFAGMGLNIGGALGDPGIIILRLIGVLLLMIGLALMVMVKIES